MNGKVIGVGMSNIPVLHLIVAFLYLMTLSCLRKDEKEVVYMFRKLNTGLSKFWWRKDPLPKGEKQQALIDEEAAKLSRQLVELKKYDVVERIACKIYRELAYDAWDRGNHFLFIERCCIAFEERLRDPKLPKNAMERHDLAIFVKEARDYIRSELQ